MNYVDTEEGTPQGGIISPTLCNVALNGLEDIVKHNLPLKKGISPGIHVIRYADDFVITGKNEEILYRCQDIVTHFLEERGLELSETKTSITHINKGFNFIGFNISRKKRNLRLNKNDKQETVLIIKPSQKGITKLNSKITEIIDQGKPIEKIIKDLNPMLRGWGEHKRISYHSQATFIKIDNQIY